MGIENIKQRSHLNGNKANYYSETKLECLFVMLQLAIAQDDGRGYLEQLLA